MSSLSIGKLELNLRTQTKIDQQMFLSPYGDKHPLSTYIVGVNELSKPFDFVEWSNSKHIKLCS